MTIATPALAPTAFDSGRRATRATTSRLERHDYGSPALPPRVSIIVPTLDRHRRGLLDELLVDLAGQTLDRFEVLLVIGDRRQGRAINRGVDEARADIIATMDDDTKIGTSTLLETLVDVLEGNPGIGIVGASTVVPPDASWFQRTASKQIPRRLFPIVDRVTDSDMVQHPCLAMRRDVFVEIGGEDEELIRGLDPVLRFKARRAGYRVVIAPHAYVSHPLPESLWPVLRMYFRNGRGSAFAQRHYPDRILNLSDGYRQNRFPEQIPFVRRALGYPVRLLGALLRLQGIRLGMEAAYGLGFAREFLLPRRRA